VHIHPDVDLMHQITAAGDFKFLPPLVAVDAPEYDLALAHRFRILLPLAGESPNIRMWLEAVNHHFRDVKLGLQ
jgi:hypothetical protein